MADLANAGWYALEGDYLNAGMSAAAAIPIIGDAAAASKFAQKGVKMTAAALGNPRSFR